MMMMLTLQEHCRVCCCHCCDLQGKKGALLMLLSLLLMQPLWLPCQQSLLLDTASRTQTITVVTLVNCRWSAFSRHWCLSGKLAPAHSKHAFPVGGFCYRSEPVAAEVDSPLHARGCTK